MSYASGTSNIISGSFETPSGRTQRPTSAFPREALFDRIGMTSAVIEPDAAGTFVGSSYVYATARDWARFGQLLLQDGVWEGKRILPEGWVEYTATPAPSAPQGGYGAHVWLNRGRAGSAGDVRWPDLPHDIVVAAGHGGQILAIVPSRRVVIVRFGESRWDHVSDTNRIVADVLNGMEE